MASIRKNCIGCDKEAGPIGKACQSYNDPNCRYRHEVEHEKWKEDREKETGQTESKEYGIAVLGYE